MNDEKRVWHASFKEYLTESEMIDRLLAPCPNLRQGASSSYTKMFFMQEKKEITHYWRTVYPEKSASYLKTFKKFLPQIPNILQLFKRTTRMFKQSY